MSPPASSNSLTKKGSFRGQMTENLMPLSRIFLVSCAIVCPM